MARGASRTPSTTARRCSPGIGSDIADPDAHETAYEGTPLRPLLTLFDGVEALPGPARRDHLPGPVMTIARRTTSCRRRTATTSPRRCGGPVERVTLERSYHVATLDYDKDLVDERAVEFAAKVTAG